MREKIIDNEKMVIKLNEELSTVIIIYKFLLQIINKGYL